MRCKYNGMSFASVDEVQDYVRGNIDKYDIADAIEGKADICLSDIVQKCLNNSAEDFGNWMKGIIEQAIEDIVDVETDNIYGYGYEEEDEE